MIKSNNPHLAGGEKIHVDHHFPHTFISKQAQNHKTSSKHAYQPKADPMVRSPIIYRVHPTWSIQQIQRVWVKIDSLRIAYSWIMTPAKNHQLNEIIGHIATFDSYLFTVYD